MKKKDILLISILLFLFVAIWVGYNTYRSIVSSTISETTNKDISPITPSFDTKKINALKERQEINPSFENISITPTVTPIASASLQPSPTEETATAEGELAQ